MPALFPSQELDFSRHDSEMLTGDLDMELGYR
jgi:hypothetical protein